MSGRRFTTGQQFLWQDTAYEVKRLLWAEQRVNIENLETGAVLLVELSTLTASLFAGELRFETDGHTTLRGIIGPGLDLSAYPSAAVEIAHWRLKVIQPMLELLSYRMPRQRR